MNLLERQVYRKEALGLTFADNKRESGFTEVMVHSKRLDREPVHAQPLTPPDLLTEIFLGFGVVFSPIEKHIL